jgi:hypothetical protein
MRKISLILAVLLLSAPALASVDITWEATGPNEVTVSYKVNGEPNLVRAFALDIIADCNIIDVNDEISEDYYIYPGSIQITGNTVDDWGSAVADNSYPGTLGGLDTNAITVEMGCLHDPPHDQSPDAPPLEGVLFKFYVDCTGGACKCNITENEARSGIVLTDPDVVFTVNLPGELTLCADDDPWNYDCFDCGDGNGDCLITFADLMIIINAWDPEDPYNKAGDFNKDGLITFADVMVIINHWTSGCTAQDGCLPCTPK